MKGKLLFHLEATSRSDHGPVTVQVRRVADDLGKSLDDDATEIFVRSGEDRTLSVDQGHFIVDVRWRNGRSARYNCAVLSEHAHRVLLVAPDVSRKTIAPGRDFTRPTAGGMSVSAPTHEVFVSDDRHDTWRFVCDRQRIEQQSQLPLASLGVERSNDIRLSAETPEERNWVEYWSGSGWAVASMPFSPDPESDICLLRSDPLGVPYVVTTDPESSVMVDLIPAGNSLSMRQYAKMAYDEFTADRRHALVRSRPIEACAFAYAEYDSFESARWISLLAEAERHANWLPDISVILGWRLLMRSRSLDERSLARNLLKRGMHAGVPYYAMGLRLLSEALDVLSIRDDELDRARAMVSKVAMRAVPTEAFTTVRP